MAATSAHGGVRVNAGRKREHLSRNEYVKHWQTQHKRIYLASNTYEAWMEAKFVAGYGKSSDDHFAAHLLSLEFRRRSDEDVCLQSVVGIPIEGEAVSGPKTSTPASTPAKFNQSATTMSLSPVAESGCDTSNKMDDRPSVSGVLQASNLNCSLFTDDEDSEVEDTCTNIREDNRRLFESAIQELNEDTSATDKSESESECSLQDDFESEDEIMSEEFMPTQSDEVTLETIMVTTDNPEDFESEDEIMPEENVPIQSDKVTLETTVTSDKPIYGPHPKLSRGEEQYEYRKEIEQVQEKKFLCSLGLFLNLFVGCCRTPGCSYAPKVLHHFIGTTLVVTAICPVGHTFKFASSREVNGFYINNFQATAALVLSGNNFLKVSKMAQFLGLPFLSESTFYRFQRLYICPAIEEWWSWMRGELIKEFVGEKIIVGGDGQCDSPGFSAKNLCYFLMELTTGYILEIEVKDKRHVGLASTNMEKTALKNALTRLKTVLNVVELATDASSSIKKMMETEFKEVFHSLDVWHKAKSIRKCLNKLGKSASMKKVKAWSGHIIRHFWHCSCVCKGENTSDEEALKIMKDKWIGLLHHVCDSHEWLGGKCDHDDTAHDPDIEWFDRRDSDFQELQKVILNAELLESFKYFVRFRHTGKIECLNSLTLAYTPKRTALSYKAYKSRKYLAAIDWNYHLQLSNATNKSGDEITSRKYNQRTQQWDLRKVKQTKGYEYIPLLTAKMLREKVFDVNPVTRLVTLNHSDPRLVAPTIAAKPPPESKELLKRRSRFSQPHEKEGFEPKKVKGDEKAEKTTESKL